MMIQVAAGIIEDGRGNVLIAQRPPGKRLAGFWEFPGGKVEAGESAAQALVRELKEELELDVRVAGELGRFPYEYVWGGVELHVFRVVGLNEPSPTDQIRVFRWINPGEIELKTFAAADHAPLKAYLCEL